MPENDLGIALSLARSEGFRLTAFPKVSVGHLVVGLSVAVSQRTISKERPNVFFDHLTIYHRI